MAQSKVPKLWRGFGAVFAAGALAVSLATPGAAGEFGTDWQRPDDGVGEAAVLAALKRDLGLSAAGATQLADAHAAALALAEQLEGELGGAFAGSWFNPHTGALTVATIDAATADRAVAAGAEAVLVSRSMSELERAHAELTAMVEADPAGLSEVIAWRVDAMANQVVVTVKEGLAASVEALLAAYGDAVSVVESAIEPSLTSHGGEPFLDGGIEYSAGGTVCSTGLNAGAGTINFVYTVAHCGQIGQQAHHHGTSIGPFVARNQGNDTAVIRVDNPFWFVGPWIWTYPGFITVIGVATALPGAAVCKSGRTTGVTCGVVIGVHETINFGGVIVTGLTRFTACVEPGDTGGAVSGPPDSAEVFALGIVVGAQLVGGSACLERFGQQNVSWYQPITHAVQIHGIPVLVG